MRYGIEMNSHSKFCRGVRLDTRFDVLINVLSDKVPPEVRDTYAQAAVEAGVKVYFPNEFVA